MSVNADFYQFSKRKNSTKQPAGTGTTFSVDLKSGTSLMAPTLLLNSSSYPNYNYCIFMGYYYFVRDIVSVRNNLWEIYLSIDALATAKSDILASTQYVSYSNVLGNAWLADTRIPLLKDAAVSKSSTTMNFLFNETGFYVLSTIGKSGCELWALDANHIDLLLDRLTDWSDDLLDDVLGGAYPWGGSGSVTYDFTSPESAIESMAKMNALTGFAGNAYSDAPNCIRSCIWVPFFASFFTSGSDEINLGQFPTGVTTFHCKSTPAVRTVTISIPWQHTDWRRAVCEEVYLYLPLVGMVNIPSDEIVKESSLSITWSATATDGCISFLVKAGNQVVGTYGANAAVNYPIGISQQASAGEIVQTAWQGLQKTVSSGIYAAHGSSFGKADLFFNAVDSVYQTANTALTRHNSCIGGIGGGAGVGLDLSCTCFTVSHDTIVTPSDMQQTMGVPTMKALALSSCSGFCQCANAHVEGAFPSPILDAVDSYLNSGFYIE